MLKHLKNKLLHYRERDLMQWRFALTPHETKLLIPDLTAKAQILAAYCSDAIAICQNHRNNETFGAAIANLNKAPPQAKAVNPQKTNQQYATEYYDGISKMIADNYYDPFKSLIASLDEINSLENLYEVLSELNALARSIFAARANFFLFWSPSFISIHNQKTGELVGSEVREIHFLSMPFDNLFANMKMMAEAITGTIDVWHKEQHQWKTKFLELRAHRASQTNHLLGIAFAIVFSWMIFVVTDPYKVRTIEDRNIELHEELIKMQKNNIELAGRETLLKSQLDEAKAQCDSAQTSTQ